MINRLDEFTIIVTFPFVIYEFYRHRKNSKNDIYCISLEAVFISIVVLLFCGLISGILNGNDLFVTFHGIFSYVKYFFIIFIYSVFFREDYEFRRILRLLLIVVFFLLIVSLLQEVWALGYRYIFRKNIFSDEVYIFRNISEGYENYWRFYIYRTPSLLIHPNMFGFYILIILTIYINFTKKINIPFVLLFIFGILVSGSRMVYTGFLLSMVAWILRYRRRIVFFTIPAVILISITLFLIPKFNLKNLIDIPHIVDLDITQKDTPVMSYREYTRKKALEVWKDHFLWGVGPGMFGGALSIKYNSHIYEEYNLVGKIKNYLIFVRGIDQFWPMILTEMGIIGLLNYIGLLTILLIIFFTLKKRNESPEIKGLFNGLIVVTLMINGIYGFGATIETSCITFTYFALTGAGIGCYPGNITPSKNSDLHY
jgi:hypothetical protein